MRNVLNRWTVNAAALLSLTLAATGIASGQATAAATRSAEVSAFATTTLMNPDYGPTNNYGYNIGADYTQLNRGLINSSIEVRYSNAPGSTVNESVFFGGMRFHGSPLFGANPYVTFLAGTGTITFVHPVATYTHDYSFVLGMGAGADIPLRHNVNLRADFLHQTWYYTPHHLTPAGLSIGISYTLLGGGLGGIR